MMVATQEENKENSQEVVPVIPVKLTEQQQREYRYREVRPLLVAFFASLLTEEQQKRKWILGADFLNHNEVAMQHRNGKPYTPSGVARIMQDNKHDIKSKTRRKNRITIVRYINKLKKQGKSYAYVAEDLNKKGASYAYYDRNGIKSSWTNTRVADYVKRYGDNKKPVESSGPQTSLVLDQQPTEVSTTSDPTAQRPKWFMDVAKDQVDSVLSGQAVDISAPQPDVLSADVVTATPASPIVIEVVQTEIPAQESVKLPHPLNVPVQQSQVTAKPAVDLSWQDSDGSPYRITITYTEDKVVLEATYTGSKDANLVTKLINIRTMIAAMQSHS